MTFSEFLNNIFTGNTLALIGAALAVLMAGIGSARGVNMVAKASVGVLSEDPSKFGKTLALQALPMTQGFYGFIVAFLILLNMKAGIFGASPALTVTEGAYYLMAALPIAIVGYYSAIKQGEVFLQFLCSEEYGFVFAAGNDSYRAHWFTSGKLG